MKGTHYWEYKKYGQETGMFRKEAGDAPAAADFTTERRTRSENAERPGWNGPGTLWIAKSEASQRKN